MKYEISIYDPVEIRLGELTFRLRKLNRQLYRELAECEKREKAAKDHWEKIDSHYETLRVYLDAPAEAIDDLTEDQIVEIINIIDKAVFKRQPSAPEKKVEDPEKNSPKPGDETAAS